jgi:hypothetical protein
VTAIVNDRDRNRPVVLQRLVARSSQDSGDFSRGQDSLGLHTSSVGRREKAAG